MVWERGPSVSGILGTSYCKTPLADIRFSEAPRARAVLRCFTRGVTFTIAKAELWCTRLFTIYTLFIYKFLSPHPITFYTGAAVAVADRDFRSVTC